jgi:ribosomal protein L33
MAAKKGKTSFVILACSICKNRTNSKKSRMLTAPKGQVPKLIKSRYCKICKKHTEHKETK